MLVIYTTHDVEFNIIVIYGYPIFVIFILEIVIGIPVFY